MWNAEGELKYKLDPGIETVDYGGDKYIIHPAFGTSLDNGGWDKGLSGFWFAKYEMSVDKVPQDGDYSNLSSVPGTSSLRSINIGKMYQTCRDAKYGFQGKSETNNWGESEITHTSYMNSHLVKNSEWGAVALLTQSAYGRNGHEISINNSSSYITGNETGNYAYNTEEGAKASTTGNIYGIYDMSGGAWEYVASFDKAGSDSYLAGSAYGADLTKEAKNTEGAYISTKYATAYNNGTTDYNSEKKVFEVSKIGDAIKEVKTGSTGWLGDYSNVCYSGYPFFKRGGYYNDGAYAGIFYSNYVTGDSNDDNGFRAVLCP